MFAVKAFIISIVLAVSYGACPRERGRTGWGATSPKSVSYFSNPPTRVLVQSTQTLPCRTRSACQSAVRALQGTDMHSRGLNDIGCSFVLGGDGMAYEGRGWDWATEYPDTLVLCVVGTFNSADMSSYQKQSFNNFLTCAVNKGKINAAYELVALRDVDPKSTNPGDKLYSQIQALPHYSGAKPTPPPASD